MWTQRLSALASGIRSRLRVEAEWMNISPALILQTRKRRPKASRRSILWKSHPICVKIRHTQGDSPIAFCEAKKLENNLVWSGIRRNAGMGCCFHLVQK